MSSQSTPFYNDNDNMTKNNQTMRYNSQRSFCAGISLTGFAPNSSKIKVNQDSFDIVEDPSTKSLLIVCLDGHGINGEKVSQIIPSRLFAHSLFSTDLKLAIQQVIYSSEKELFEKHLKLAEYSGTTLSLAVVRGDRLTVANIGDSRIVLGCRNKRNLHHDQSISNGGLRFNSNHNCLKNETVPQPLLGQSEIDASERLASIVSQGFESGSTDVGDAASDADNFDQMTVDGNDYDKCEDDLVLESEQWTATALTVDHKPQNSNEFNRIVSCGGRVFSVQFSDGRLGPPRVWLKNYNVPGLAMSRSLGDFVVHTAGVISVPDIFEVQLHLSEKDYVLILATDGLWDAVSNSEAVILVTNISATQTDWAAAASSTLAYEARHRWKTLGEGCIDDITICIANISI